MPLAASLFADSDLLIRHRQAMLEHGRGHEDIIRLVAAYLSEEQKLGRNSAGVAPMAAAALLLGPCFQRVFIRQAMGRDLLPMTDAMVAAAIVRVMLQGLNPRA